LTQRQGQIPGALFVEVRPACRIGPRRVGRLYRVGASAEYEVLAIEPGPRTSRPSWQITVRWTEVDRVTSHTGWDTRRDTVVAPSRAFLALVAAAPETDHGGTSPARFTDLSSRASVLSQLA
jgi:hypothetical protein